ncbi:MAG: SIMPL domain-containing protein [Erythrobacter sp.]
MIRTIALACAASLGALALALPAAASAAPNIEIKASGPVIELNIFENMAAEPDMVTIGAGVSSEARTATEALRMNSAEMVKVIDQLKRLGVPERDIQTTGINLNAMYDYDQGARRQVFRGYQASNRVSVKMRKIDETGRVLDALVAAGANDLSGPSFGLENDEPAKDAARTRALERAKMRAEDYARQLGYSGARVLAIRESMSGSSPMPERAMMRASADMMAAPVPPVQPGMVQTGISITIQYELIGGGPAA